MGYGFNGFIGLGRETGWGSAVAATDFIEAMSEDLSATLERFGYKAMIASMGEPDDATGLLRVAGSIRAAAHPGNLAQLLRGVLHSFNTTSATGPLYTHAFVTTSGGADFSSEVPHQPYSFEVFRDVTSSVRYAGCLIDTLTFNFNTQGAVMVEAGIIGRSAAQLSKSAPTFPNSPTPKPFTFDTVSLSVGGAGTSLIETLSVQIQNNFEGLGALNLSQYIAKVRRGNHQMVNIQGTMDFSTMGEYQKFIDQTEQRLTVSVTKTGSAQLVIDVPRMVYTAFPLGVPGRERLTVSFTGKGFVHPGSQNAIKVSLTTPTSMQ
jgi:hypothetical protein